MTYQPPYQPPTGGFPNFDYYYQQQPDYLAPARRAATMLFVIGIFAIVSSFCCIGGGAMLPQLMQNPEFATRMQSIPGVTPEMLRAGAFVFGIGSFIFGVTYITLGVFVRRGSKGAAVTAMVLSILAMILLLFEIVGPFVTGQATREHMLGMCVFVIPLALLALLMVWLVGAMKASEQATAARYAMEYWRYAQQQQGLQGYPQQMPPPPQSPPAEAGGPPSDAPPPVPPQE